MGTELGIKGVELDPSVPERIRALTELRAEFGLSFEIFVDGGIRSTTAPLLASSCADGIVPGSLVFKTPDPIAAVRWIHSLHQGAECRGGDVPISDGGTTAVDHGDTVATS